MRVKLLVILSFHLCFPINKIYSQSKKNLSLPTHYYNTKIMDINELPNNVNNIGGVDPFWPGIGYWGSTLWNQIDTSVVVYDQGLWVVGKINNYPHWAMNRWSSSYSPGPIIDGEPAMAIYPEDSLRYRVYKISTGDDTSNVDYADWPVDFGAPVNDLDEPLVYGNQTLWTAYNALDSTLEYRQWWNINNDTLPVMPLEIQQLSYARQGNFPDDEDLFSNVIFYEWTIINKSNHTIDSTYIGFWTDIDFFEPSMNYPAIDTTRQLGFCWTDVDTLSWRTGEPLAVGYTLLYGPVVPAPGQTAIFRGKQINDYKNVSLSSFHGISDDGGFHPVSGMPHLLTDAWDIARGFDFDGNIIINPITNQQTKFPFSGDPVTNTGWIYDRTIYGSGGGAGFVMFAGPLTLAANDTQWVMAALVPGLGADRLQSIDRMRQKTDILRSLPYDSLAFGKSPLFVNALNQKDIIVPKTSKLYYNYPNPFNPTTSIKYSIAKSSKVNLIVYDILGKKVVELVNEVKKAGEYNVTFDGSKYASGLYFYKLKSGDYFLTRKMLLMK